MLLVYSASEVITPRFEVQMATFGAADVVRAAGVPAKRLSVWLDRGLFWPSLPSTGSGVPHAFSAEDVLAIAVAWRLIGLGVSPASAFAAARVAARAELSITGRSLLVVTAAGARVVSNGPLYDGEASIVVDLTRLRASLNLETIAARSAA